MPSAMAAATEPWTLTSCMLEGCCSMLSNKVPSMHATAAEYWLPRPELTVGGSPVGNGELLQQDLQRALQLIHGVA